jgi:branched-chain amino acid transport system ATP-binding protein
VLTLAGVMRPWEGTITYDGEDVTKVDVEQMVARGVTLVPEGRRVFPNLPVEENLRVGAWAKRKDKDFLAEQMQRCFRYFPRLRERATRSPARCRVVSSRCSPSPAGSWPTRSCS